MFGISIGISESNIIVGNTISNSTSQGIVLWDSPNNAIYHNNFVNNTLHFYDTGATPSLNAWDDGEEGNFWSDYNGTDANSDGIGDTPYRVDSNNQDGYPLMKRWDPAKPVDNAPPQISISSPENKLYNVSSVPLTFSANEAASRISFSLDNQDNVTIAGNTTISDLPNGSHNLTVYATDQYGNTGASETVYFSVEVPFPTTLVVTASVVAVAVVGAGLLVYFKKRKH
jgi:parallel beta-helix repeat protein